ncbi:hypothetical protein MMC17_003283 [Xylographa soralifera]|nr:hypothetical protein [Xylographa soralifera]
MDPLSLTITVVGLIQATSVVVQYIYDFKDAGKERSKLAQEVIGLSLLLQQLEARLHDALAGDPWFEGCLSLATPDGTISQLTQVVKELQLKLSPETGLKRLGQKLTWSISKTDLDKMLTQIERLKSQINITLNQDQFQISKAIERTGKETSEGVQALQDAKKFEEIIAWLSPLKFPAQQQQIFTQAIATTGQWLLESDEFETWVLGCATKLYCPGIPGAGKTVLSSIVINHLQNRCQDQHIPVLYIFLNHKDSLDQSLPNLIGSLLKQLVQYQAPKVPSERVKKLWEAGKREEMPPSLETLKETLHAELRSFAKTYVVVDALDECLIDSTRNELLELLHNLWVENVSLMITSRPLENKFGSVEVYCDQCGMHDLRVFYHCAICNAGEYDLCDKCVKDGKVCLNDSHSLAKLYACVKIEISATEADLQTYIEYKIDTEPRLSSICRKDEKAKGKIVEVVVDVAGGMFLIAKLLMDSLKTKATPRAVTKALQTLPTTLDDIYEETLKRIETQCEDDVNIAKKVLSWVVWSNRALKVHELLQALAVSPEDDDLDTREVLEEEIIFSVTAGLIMTDYEGCIRLVHYTTQKYFEENKSRWFPDAQIEMALTTLTYLNFESFAEPCQGSDEDEELDVRIQEYPFLVYASQYWGEHARQSYGLKSEVRKAVLTLIRNPLRLASSIQAAWYSGSGWDVRKGLNSLHVCAWFGLDDLLMELLKQGLSIDSQDPVYGQTSLMYACKRGHSSTVAKLLDLGASINIRSARESTALFEAVQANKIEIVELLLQKDELDVNAKYPKLYDFTALSFACSSGFAEIMTLLLRRPDILVNEKDVEGMTVLAIAASASTPIYLKLLLGHIGVDKNCVDNAHRTPLFTAAELGYAENVQVLLESGADPSIKDIFGGTCILRAIDYGDISTLQTMIRHGVDLGGLDNFNRTLLHGASINGQNEMVKLLIDAGLDVNAQGSRGETPLHDVAQAGYVDIAKVLLERGANPSIQDNEGRTPQVVAVQEGQTAVAQILKDTEFQKNGSEEGGGIEPVVSIWGMAKLGLEEDIKKYITNGGDLNKKDPTNGNDALHSASWAGKVEILSVLLDAGLDPNSTNNYGRTPLHLCAIQDLLEGTRLLIEHNAILDKEDMWGKTALTTAQSFRYFAIAIELIAAGASIDSRLVPIQPSFFAAIEMGNVVAVKRLIDAGADPQALDYGGQTGLQLAKAQDHTEIIQLLREHKSFYVPSRTASQRSEASPATSPPAYQDVAREPFQARPILKK